MSLFASPEEHAANPPETWAIVKIGERAWNLTDGMGNVLDRFKTRRDAELARTSGFTAVLYAKESRWYAGEHVPPWRPWVEVKAEQDRNTAYQAGRRAHSIGAHPAPALDVTVRTLIADMAVGTGAAEVMAAFTRGWNASAKATEGDPR